MPRWLVAAALAAGLARSDRPPLYFYWHVPKCGGVSFSSDLVTDFGMKSCFGRQVKKQYENTTWAMLKGKCDMGNVEGGYAYRARSFPWPPRDLLLLRDPATHVVSQYAHCQMDSDRRKWGHKRASLEDWLDAWTKVVAASTTPARASALEAAKAICHYDPVNMQARKLCDRYDRGTRDVARAENDTACLDAALGHVRAAWHVGHLEAYVCRRRHEPEDERS